MKKFLSYLSISLLFGCAFTACSDDDPKPGNDTPGSDTPQGLYIVNNGNYGSANASLSFYSPADNAVSNNLFYNANQFPLGDTAQSMSIDSEGYGWVVINVSNVIFKIDLNTNKEVGRVDEGLVSPRNILFLNAHKAYVTQMYTNTVAILDTDTYTVTGYITVPGMSAADGSTEQLLAIDGYVYVNCWSYQKEIVKIDPATDTVVERLEVGIQPKFMANGGDSKLWVITDGGGWEQNPIGFTNPRLHCINLAGGMSIAKTYEMPLNASPAGLDCHNGNLYWLMMGEGVYTMAANTTATALPATPLVASSSLTLYCMTVSPANGDIYVGDAGDWTQPGTVTRYAADGAKVADFTVGVIPAAFCWNLK